MCQENRYFVKNMLLLKNPQFLPNHLRNFVKKWGFDEDLILTKFRNDWVKIVDFLIKAYFWPSPETTVTQCKYYILTSLYIHILWLPLCSKWIVWNLYYNGNYFTNSNFIGNRTNVSKCKQCGTKAKQGFNDSNLNVIRIQRMDHLPTIGAFPKS